MGYGQRAEAEDRKALGRSCFDGDRQTPRRPGGQDTREARDRHFWGLGRVPTVAGAPRRSLRARLSSALIRRYRGRHDRPKQARQARDFGVDFSDAVGASMLTYATG